MIGRATGRHRVSISRVMLWIAFAAIPMMAARRAPALGLVIGLYVAYFGFIRAPLLMDRRALWGRRRGRDPGW